MTNARRRFLQGGATIAASAALPLAGHAKSDRSVAEEMGKRLKHLVSPAGTPPDLLAMPSPPLNPFNEYTLEELRPPVGQPLFTLSTEETEGMDDQQWWELFRIRFHDAASVLRSEGFVVPGDWPVRGEQIVGGDSDARVRIDIGDPPSPDSHQRFFEFRPQKFYINREVEFLWRFHEQYSNGCLSWGYHNIYWDADSNDYRSTRACSPGTTFHARYGEPILVRRINDLPDIGHADGHSQLRFALPSTTSHLHNAHTASESDGYPGDWINPGEYWDHHYCNFPSGNDDREKLSTLWYHDHRMDFTASNVYAGLDGFYLLFDEEDANDESAGWHLPSGDYDIPLIFHDLLFAQQVDGAPVKFSREQTTRWTFESSQDWSDYGGNDRGAVLGNGDRKAIEFRGSDTVYDPSPQIIFDGFNTDGIIGDRWTVNRRVQPKLPVEPRKYRLRLLNGGPSRFYEFFLHATGVQPSFYRSYSEGEGEVVGPTTELDHPFIVICGDGNFQPNPVLAHSIYLGVAQRVDVIIDFSKFADSTVYLVNRLEQEHGRGPSERKIDPADYASDEDFYKANAFMAFAVQGTGVRSAEKSDYGFTSMAALETDPDPSAFPLLFREFPKVDFSEVKRERLWEFDYDGGLWTINGDVFDPNRVDAGIEQDSAEIWTFRNGGNGWHHPIHSHFTEFIILERDSQPFLHGTIQTQLFTQENELLETAGSFVTPRSMAELFKLEDYEGKDSYDDLGSLKSEFLDNLDSSLSESDAENAHGSRSAPRANAMERVDQLISMLAPEQQVLLLDALLRGDFENTEFRSYDYFALWVELFPLLGLGSPKVDRFLGGPRRDVALLLPNTEVTVFARWKDFMGKHVMHCHNVVHEDHAMMIRWDIVPQGHGFDTPQMSDEIAQALGDDIELQRRNHYEAHPEGGAHQPDDS